MDTEERLSELERKMAEHDELIVKLVKLASTNTYGRLVLKILGLKT